MGFSPLEFLADTIERAHGTTAAPAAHAVAGLLDGKDPIKLLRVAVLTAFCVPGLFSAGAWAAEINHRLMILIHEGGHGFFGFTSAWGPAGRFVTIAAGSGAQIFLPLLFMAAVYSTGRRFDVSLMFLWLGLNFVDVSRYAADAQARAMPLIMNLGPEAHDWGNMLEMTGLLWATPVVASGIWLMGLGCFGATVVLGFLTANRNS